MILFLAKLTLTPLIMFLTSAASRRWGPGVSGWLTGLPLLAGPVSVFVCIEQGPGFAQHAAGATLLGMWSSCAFCLAYDALAARGWAAASLAARQWRRRNRAPGPLSDRARSGRTASGRHPSG